LFRCDSGEGGGWDDCDSRSSVLGGEAGWESRKERVQRRNNGFKSWIKEIEYNPRPESSQDIKEQKLKKF
jgi:hypothetical protein